MGILVGGSGIRAPTSEKCLKLQGKSNGTFSAIYNEIYLPVEDSIFLENFGNNVLRFKRVFIFWGSGSQPSDADYFSQMYVKKAIESLHFLDVFIINKSIFKFQSLLIKDSTNVHDF